MRLKKTLLLIFSCVAATLWTSSTLPPPGHYDHTGYYGTCGTCGGSGTLSTYCPHCKGKGFIEEGAVPCPYQCKGGYLYDRDGKKYVCAGCNGKGLIVKKSTCHVCNGKGKETCSRCGGTGEVYYN